MKLSRGRRPLLVAVALVAAGIAVGTQPNSTGQAATPSASTSTTATSTVPVPGPALPPPPSPPLTAAPDPALTAALDAIWRDSAGGCLGVTAGERILYERNADAAVAPASVTKVLTAAAVLRVLGPDTQLHTSVRAASPPVDGVVTGDLWLVGGGDPVLGTDAWAAQLDPDGRLYTSLDALADRLVAGGVRRVEGRVVADESRYDADRYVDTWPDRLVADGEVGPLSALSVNDGFSTWGHPGVPFADPPAEAAGIFRELLVDRGVTIAGTAAAGPSPRRSVELAGAESPAVRVLVHAMLRDSDNGTAELFLKELGRHRFGEGATVAGARVVGEVLAAAGAPLGSVTIADGSGLSDAARVTCRALTSVLASHAGSLSGRLAVAGRDGTLARRLLGTPAAGRIRAKTGSLDGTAALAGYAITRSGTVIEFAYVVNGLPRGASVRALQDRLSVVLVTATPGTTTERSRAS